MAGTIETTWKDEILNGLPKYRIRKNGEIIQDNIEIEQITPTIQAPTELNKETLETQIGEIRFFSNQRNDDKYLLCDGSRILKSDYPVLTNQIPPCYIYDSYSVSTSYGYITLFTYIEKKNIYFMVRRGISDEIGFTIWSSSDGENWTLRYTSGSGYYSQTPYISYYEKANIFVAKSNKLIITSPDGITWTVAKSETSSGDYVYSDITYSERLQKWFYIRYKTSSTYYSYVFSTTDFVTFTQIASKSGSAMEIMRGRIIDDGVNLYSSGQGSIGTPNYINALWKSTDNGASWSLISESNGFGYGEPLFHTNSAIKFGEYWYCYWGTSSSTNFRIRRTKDFVTMNDIATGLSSAGIIGIINGYLYVHKNGTLVRIDEAGNQKTFSSATNLRYIYDRNEFVKIESNLLYSSKDLMTWKNYDIIGTTVKLSSIFYLHPVNKIYALNSDSYTSTYFLYDEREINLPNVDFNYAYIKALDGSE